MLSRHLPYLLGLEHQIIIKNMRQEKHNQTKYFGLGCKRNLIVNLLLFPYILLIYRKGSASIYNYSYITSIKNFIYRLLPASRIHPRSQAFQLSLSVIRFPIGGSFNILRLQTGCLETTSNAFWIFG